MGVTVLIVDQEKKTALLGSEGWIFTCAANNSQVEILKIRSIRGEYLYSYEGREASQSLKDDILKEASKILLATEEVDMDNRQTSLFPLPSRTKQKSLWEILVGGQSYTVEASKKREALAEVGKMRGMGYCTEEYRYRRLTSLGAKARKIF